MADEGGATLEQAAVRGRAPAAAGGSFELTAPYEPAGDQPRAIAELEQGLRADAGELTLLGVTGSGKTYTVANLVARLNRPSMVLAHNKTLAAQLYGEFRALFPSNAVEYFVSYYDYYQPEAYVPARDLYIDKDSCINDQIEQLRLSATKSLIERRDVLVVATVSAIFGIGDPVDYHAMILHLRRGERIGRAAIVKRLVAMQYRREKYDFQRGSFRVRGDVVDVFPAEHSELAIRARLFDDEIEELELFDPLTGTARGKVPRFTVYPSSHYALPAGKVSGALGGIKRELSARAAELEKAGRLVEAQRLSQRTLFDLEKMEATGTCKGIENYTRHLSGRQPGEPPPTLFDYLPADGLLFIDESHVTVPQVGAMFKGDRSRKETLVEYGFRLPSALDNRPLRFEEFDALRPQTVYISATPAEFETKRSRAVVEMVARPTGLVDPAVHVRPARSQVDDLLSEAKEHAARGERTLVTTLTKRMAEQLTEYLKEHGVKATYMHADIDTLERAQIIRDLRSGTVDVLVGINLLREGLDLPEVALVAILDADKEGFLRSERSLIQTIGRAARHLSGKAILYAEDETGSMRRALRETERRRQRQQRFNEEHGIRPQGIKKAVAALIEGIEPAEPAPKARPEAAGGLTQARLEAEIERVEGLMRAAARELEYERAAEYRDDLRRLREMALGLAPPERGQRRQKGSHRKKRSKRR